MKLSNTQPTFCKSITELHALLSPKILRSREVPSNLSHIHFNSEEKRLIVDDFEKRHLQTSISLSEYAKQHCIPRTTLQDWKDKIDKHQILNNSGGRPTILSEEREEHLKHDIRERA